MTKEELLSLPASVAISVLYDCLDEETTRALGNVEKPAAPKCPRFDRKIFRQGGIMWASECDDSCLRYWHGRALEPPSDPKYTDANRKQAEELARWIAWREWYPGAVWSGERDGKQGLAKPPSAKPALHPRTGGGAKPAPPPDDDINTDSDIPW